MKNFGQRLKSARIMAKLSMDELVGKINGIVSKQSISKYERGLMEPNNSNIVIKLADALNVPVDYFFRKHSLSFQAINFRKKTGLSVKEVNSIKERVRDLLDRYFEIESLLCIDSKFKNPLHQKVFSQEDIEESAIQLRRDWKLGESSPIINVIDLLEENGVKIVELDVPEGFEGLSGWIDQNPFVILNIDSVDDRKRFTALHELAHLILHFDSRLSVKDQERLCYCFAGAILLPKPAFIKKLKAGERSNISLFELIQIKEQYGISIQAIMARARALGIISRYTYKQFNIFINRHGLKRQEPGKYPVKEESVRFRQLLHHALAEGIISISKASIVSRTSIEQLEREMVKGG